MVAEPSSTAAADVGEGSPTPAVPGTPRGMRRRLEEPAGNGENVSPRLMQSQLQSMSAQVNTLTELIQGLMGSQAGSANQPSSSADIRGSYGGGGNVQGGTTGGFSGSGGLGQPPQEPPGMFGGNFNQSGWGAPLPAGIGRRACAPHQARNAGT